MESAAHGEPDGDGAKEEQRGVGKVLLCSFLATCRSCSPLGLEKGRLLGLARVEKLVKGCVRLPPLEAAVGVGGVHLGGGVNGSTPKDAVELRGGLGSELGGGGGFRPAGVVSDRGSEIGVGVGVRGAKEGRRRGGH